MESKNIAFNYQDDNEKKRIIPTDKMNPFKSLDISGKYNAEIIVKHLSIPMNDFEQYNPSFNKEIMQNGRYHLMLPDDKMNLFISKKYEILHECVEKILNNSR
jgi:hypothetical protein